MTETEVKRDTLEIVREAVARYKHKKGVLVSVLQDVQKELRYIPEDALHIIARELNLSFAQVYGVASFYAQFYFTPRGENIVQVCTGTACHIRGATEVLEKFEEELGIKDGETSPNLKFTLQTVSCVGCCGLAPVAVVNDQIFKKKDHAKTITRIKGEKL